MTKPAAENENLYFSNWRCVQGWEWRGSGRTIRHCQEVELEAVTRSFSRRAGLSSDDHLRRRLKWKVLRHWLRIWVVTTYTLFFFQCIFKLLDHYSMDKGFFLLPKFNLFKARKPRQFLYHDWGKRAASCLETSVKAEIQSNMTHANHVSLPGHPQPKQHSVWHVHPGWAREDISQSKSKCWMLAPGSLLQPGKLWMVG